MVSKSEFNAAVRACGYNAPSSEVYREFANATSDWDTGEVAMFLAQLIHESGGFQYKEEIAFAGNNHHDSYRDNVGLPGKTYHGRGYIQLTWGSNYKAASEALGMGDRLVRHPEMVANDTRIAMLVSVWYWEDVVRPKLRQRPNCFGVTTNAINGAIECSGGYNERAHRRYEYYCNVANALGVRRASERGCYN